MIKRRLSLVRNKVFAFLIFIFAASLILSLSNTGTVALEKKFNLSESAVEAGNGINYSLSIMRIIFPFFPKQFKLSTAGIVSSDFVHNLNEGYRMLVASKVTQNHPFIIDKENLL